MAERKANPPFHSLAFTLVEAVRGRSVFRMTRQEDGTYSLQVKQGSEGNPKIDFQRVVPQETAQQLKDALQEAGVFSWEPSYGSVAGRPAMRWNLSIVFKKDVFSITSGGGNDTPPSFEALMEQFYRLDLPRPEEDVPVHDSQAPASWLSGMDTSKLADMFPEADLDNVTPEDMQEAFREAANDPAAFKQRMQMEFRDMPADQRDRLLDALAAMGVASRSWWENFLGGGGL